MSHIISKELIWSLTRLHYNMTTLTKVARLCCLRDKIVFENQKKNLKNLSTRTNIFCYAYFQLDWGINLGVGLFQNLHKLGAG